MFAKFLHFVFQMVRKQRNDKLLRDDKSKTLKPVLIRSKEGGVGIGDEEQILNEMHDIIKGLESVKLRSEDQIITVEDHEDFDVSTPLDVSNPSDLVDYILKIVKQAGVIGESLLCIKVYFKHKQVKNYRQLLIMVHCIYINFYQLL